MKKKCKIVEVEWLDITDRNEWQTSDEIDKEHCCIVRTYGILYSYNSKELKVIPTVAEDIDKPYGDVVVIPKGCIKKIRKLYYKEEK